MICNLPDLRPQKNSGGGSPAASNCPPSANQLVARSVSVRSTTTLPFQRVEAINDAAIRALLKQETPAFQRKAISIAQDFISTICDAGPNAVIPPQKIVISQGGKKTKDIELRYVPEKSQTQGSIKTICVDVYIDGALTPRCSFTADLSISHPSGSALSSQSGEHGLAGKPAPLTYNGLQGCSVTFLNNMPTVLLLKITSYVSPSDANSVAEVSWACREWVGEFRRPRLRKEYQKTKYPAKLYADPIYRKGSHIPSKYIDSMNIQRELAAKIKNDRVTVVELQQQRVEEAENRIKKMVDMLHKSGPDPVTGRFNFAHIKIYLNGMLNKIFTNNAFHCTPEQLEEFKRQLVEPSLFFARGCTNLDSHPILDFFKISLPKPTAMSTGRSWFKHR
jgi:hypothetical protein